MKPIIGLNVDIRGKQKKSACVNSDYYNAILQAGGIPLLIPPVPQAELSLLLRQIQGLVLIGGDDYSPKLYGEEIQASVELIEPAREEFDLRLANYVLKETQMPILAICGGLQLVNIVMGGSLIQDIPTSMPGSSIKHGLYKDPQTSDLQTKDPQAKGLQDKELPKHLVDFVPDSKLSKIYGKKDLLVISSHHQSVKQLAKGLKATALAEDGIIEAFELLDHPFMQAVQWHPERDFVTNRPLFEQFVAACSLAKEKVNR